jgi:DHA2 family multidrug resistance protein
MYHSVDRLQLGMSFGFAQWMRVLQVLGLPFLFVPITLVAYVGLPAEKGNSIAGMLNFMRNIGSSVGTSFVTTMIARRAQLHQVYLTAHVTPGSPKFEEAAAGLAAYLTQSGLDAATATERAYAMI